MAFSLIVVTTSTCCLIIIFLYFMLINKRAKAQNLPPGPPKLPLIGNIHQLAGLLPHRAFRDLARKHGPIMHVQLGSISAVIISSPRLAKEVLKTHDVALADRPKTFGSELVLYGTTDVALSPYGDYWRQMKRICSLELLSAKRVQSYAMIREHELDGFMEFLRLSSGKPINIHKTITKLINNVVCIASFGKNCKQQHALLEFLDEFARVNSGFYLADLFPDFKFLYVVSGLRSKMMKLHKTIDKIFDDILEEHTGKRRDGEAGEEDLLEVLLKIKEEGGLEFPITNNNIKAIFVDIFGGGTDTSSITIEWAMTEMIRHPSVMEKVQHEVREAFQGKRKIRELDIQSLSYLHCVIKETLRLHPPIPMLLPRVCREQCKIGGYDIPIKMKVMINAWACSTDPEFWEDPDSFRPERFETTSVDFKGTHYQYIPFGSGRRMCPGITFGLASIELFLAQMLYNFDWKLADGSNPLDIDMMEGEGVFAAKKVHLHLIPTPYAPDN
ncbi:premnaspirodiene oxygenase-like [Cynara cardunculus var. scolymus]|nr:premnaspirodiene oxygenase-like [Cynara cardunculus var. scolymus]